MSRKTRRAIRSIPPQVPKISPEAKSTMRLASASSISVRSMTTGMLARMCSPTVRAASKPVGRRETIFVGAGEDGTVSCSIHSSSYTAAG